jgi:excisionase family DNA binding protein
VATTGRSKQQVVTDLLQVGLDDNPPGNEVRAAAATNEVLTLAEVAALLQVSEANVTAAIRKDRLPGRSIGGEWRFARSAVLQWLGLSPSNSDSSAPIGYTR